MKTLDLKGFERRIRVRRLTLDDYPNVETVMVHELDLDLLRRNREAGSGQNWSARRRDFYALSYTEAGRQRTVGVRED